MRRAQMTAKAGWKALVTPGLLALTVAGLAGCARATVEGVAHPVAGGGARVAVTLENFVFRPNLIAVAGPGPLTVTASNVSGTTHNVTLLAPGGETLTSVDVPAGRSVTFDVTLPGPGRYAFYCDVFLHRPLGMDGVVRVD